MPPVQTTTKRSPKAAKAPAAKPRARQRKHAQLLKLAAKHRPPQSWYDETIDPTKRAARRAR